MLVPECSLTANIWVLLSIKLIVVARSVAIMMKVYITQFLPRDCPLFKIYYIFMRLLKIRTAVKFNVFVVLSRGLGKLHHSFKYSSFNIQ